jgi:5-methylcytosine-specific restriction endonuclease McrA
MLTASRAPDTGRVGAWDSGSTRRWRRTRARVLQRDGHRCQLKIESTCIGTATHAHHIHGRGGPCQACRQDAESHLIAACAPCNLRVGDPMKGADPPAVPITRW